MTENTGFDRLKTTAGKSRGDHSARSARGYSLGIDIGSTSSDMVVLDKNDNIIYSDYQRTGGRPAETFQRQIINMLDEISLKDIKHTAITGSAGRFLAKLLDIQFINEVPAQAAAIAKLYPEFDQASIIEMGGQDSKLIFLHKQEGRHAIRDFALNTVCAAGTGSFLDQQAQRLGVDIEGQFGDMAVKAKSVPRMAGRCSVFAKSDMIHLQQQATPTEDIIAGLCLALARNLKSNLGCGREFVPSFVFTGGVAANKGVINALEQVFELEPGELVVPDCHFFTGALGAVLVARERADQHSNGQLHIERLESYLGQRGGSMDSAPKREPLNQPSVPSPTSRVYTELVQDAKEPIDAYLGVDVGSISTNVVLADKEKRVLAKAYLMTAGQPLEAVRNGLELVRQQIGDKIRVIGAATTGSGRYLTGDFIGADTVINEITAQAAGAAIVKPDVDTIFEIGGQDSKYISLENGVVVDFEMNHACAAGTGSFLEEQAQRLGISIKNEFAALALQSAEPLKLGDRCTVFMESDLLNYQQQGAEVPEMVSGLAYSIAENYLNRVVGRRKVGTNICFQGGTAFNKAVWSAFEKITGKSITVPDHHEVTGALGAASIAAEHMQKLAEQGLSIETNFRGFDNLVTADYTVESFSCEKCSNSCEIKKVDLPGSDPLYYGSRCDIYNLKKKAKKKDKYGAFEYRQKELIRCAGLEDEPLKNPKGTIGIPRALVFWQQLPLFGRFFRELGFEVVISSATNKKTIRRGVESVTSQPCFPVKVAYGHVLDLVDKKVDHIFLPSISTTSSNFGNKYNQLCPYVQSWPFQIRSALGDKLGSSKILSVPMYFDNGKGMLNKSFKDIAKELGVSGKKAIAAYEESERSQKEFEASLLDKGREILGSLEKDERLFVLVSRPYNGCDQGMNLELPAKLAELGVSMIPLEMLNLSSAKLSDKELHKDVYWSYGQKILRAGEIIREDDRLFAIFLSNFSCGPDSFLQTFFKDLMKNKPSLLLELDEHSADAGLITRLEAYLESLKHYKPSEFIEKPAAARTKLTPEHTLYIPYMGDCAYGVASAFKAFGQKAQVMPMATEKTLLRGRQYTTGKECLPCAVTAGDMLTILDDPANDPEKCAFFMPGGSGPCRFGMYNSLHRLVLKYVDASGAIVVSPNQNGSFYDEMAAMVGSKGMSKFMRYVWAATVGIDLMSKAILKIRPYAKDRKLAQASYDNALEKWQKAVESTNEIRDLVVAMEDIAEQLAAVPLNESVRKPTIGIVGEIYVRSHPFSNKNIIKQLEDLGAACRLASLAEWMYYVNWTRVREARQEKKAGRFVVHSAQDMIQRRLEAKIAAPLEKKLGPLCDDPVTDTLKAGRPYINDCFEGEAILSVGKMVEYHHQGLSGVINVMPFGCMPSTIVSTQTLELSKNCGNMPILNVSFDGQEDPTLLTRLEAFVEQVRQVQGANLSAKEALRV